MKQIFVIIGSASQQSANEKLVAVVADMAKDFFHFTIFHELKTLPHFDPELSRSIPPQEIVAFRKAIDQADGVLICTPEYVFSIPSGLKNALEWCVSTTLFSGKPVGLITASAQGEMGHKELQIIMQTLMASCNEQTSLLISGIKGKVNTLGQITDSKTVADLTHFLEAFKTLVGA